MEILLFVVVLVTTGTAINSLSEFEVIRLFGELLAIISTGAVLIGRVLRVVTSLHGRLDHLDQCVDGLKDDVKNSLKDHETLREEAQDMRDELMYLKGAVGIPLSTKVENSKEQTK